MTRPDGWHLNFLLKVSPYLTVRAEYKMICLGNTEEAVMLKNLLKNNLHLRTCNCQILLVVVLIYGCNADSHSLLDDKIDASDKAGPCEKRSSSCEPSEGPASSKVIGETHSANFHGQPGSCASSISDCVAAVSASSGPGLSPSSSMGSLSSKKSTLDPHAKEFKLNHNAKSFTPSQTAARPSTPVSDGSFYYQPQMSPVPHMHMPVSFGIGPSFPGHQPVIFGQQVAPTQSSQPYYHPNGPQYGQQTLLGQRQVVYYQPEMQYKGGRRH